MVSTLANWDRRLTLLGVALAAVELTSWLGSLWDLVFPGRGNQISSSGVLDFEASTSVYLVLIGVIVALLPDIISGVVRARTQQLQFVLLVGAFLGTASALISLVAAALAYTDNVRFPTRSPLHYVAGVGFGAVVAALSITGLSDARFVPGLGGFRPPPLRQDLENPSP